MRQRRRTRQAHVRRVVTDHDVKIADKIHGKFEAADDEPGRECPHCKTRVKLNSNGVMRQHAPGGRARTKDNYPCPGEDEGTP